MTSIGKEEEMKHELFATLASMDHEIPEKSRDKYSLDELIQLVRGVHKGKKHGHK